MEKSGRIDPIDTCRRPRARKLNPPGFLVELNTAGHVAGEDFGDRCAPSAPWLVSKMPLISKNTLSRHALQAGGPGFDSPWLHERVWPGPRGPGQTGLIGEA